jgi:hypothetical protein
VLRYRLKSPLRWLSGVMSALMVLAIASILQSPWLMLLAPAALALFLLLPPIGVYRHDETPLGVTGVHLEAWEVREGAYPLDGSVRFRMVLVNPGNVSAENFRVRLLIPHTLVPPQSRMRPLGTVYAGQIGVNWSIDSAYDATAITLRTAPAGSPEEIRVPPGSRQELADLVLPSQARPFDVALDYQVNGGTVKAALQQLRLKTDLPAES